MKMSKKLIIAGLILTSLTFSVGCSSRKADVNKITTDEIERLPEDQKESELDKTLAEIRKQRKEKYSISNGSSMSASPVDSGIAGQTKNRPDFSQEGEALQAVILDYIENTLKIPKRPVYEYDSSQCIDPRMNAIYDESDKGVANGYDNENIYVAEYETKDDDIYSYLVLVRNSKDSPWKVIHNGTSYKE